MGIKLCGPFFEGVTMNPQRSTLQTHLKAKKPYQYATEGRRYALHLIRIN